MDEQETAQADAVEETQDASEETTTENSSSKEEIVDYKAIAEEERQRREKAEKALAERAFKEREAKRDHTEDESSDDEDKPLTRKDLAQFETRIRQQTQKELEETRALEIARANTSSEDEAQAAVLYWKNRVVPTGNLQEDVLFAVGGLNHRKTAAKASELARAIRSRETTAHDSASTHRDPTPGTEPKMSAGDKAAYTAAGFTFDSSKRLWTKKLPNGQTLHKDPKTKKSWVA